MAALDRIPGDLEAAGQFAAERGVVDPADRSLLVLEEPGVEGEPAAGRVLDLGGDEGVGVQLRVNRPGGVLAKSGNDQAPGVDLVDAVPPPSCDRPVPLEVAERRVHRRVVGGEDLGPDPRVRRQGPQH